MAKTVAGVGGVEVRCVFAPGLAEETEIGLDVRAGDGEERAEDTALGKGDDGMDGGEAFGPGAAEEFGEDGFGLVVEGVGGSHGVNFAGSHELAKPGVAKAAGGFFDALPRFGWSCW